MTVIEKNELLLSREYLHELVLRAWDSESNTIADKAAYEKLALDLIPPLSGRIHIAIIDSTLFTAKDIPDLARETLVKTLRRYRGHVEAQDKKAVELNRFAEKTSV